MSGSKRKRVVLTMEAKLKALERLDKGESVKLICDEYGVGKSTVNDWRKNRKSIQDFCMQIESDRALSTRCTLRKPNNEIVDDALWIWFMQERRKGTPISGPILKEKALMLHSKIENGGEFTASEGWLTRWKHRHGINYLSVSGEKLSADTAAASSFTDHFAKIIQEECLQPEQVYNIDETGVNFKKLPKKTFVSASEKSAPGFKLNKERITVALCTNATGTHRLPLFCVGKSKNPRAFKHLNKAALPVCYKAQKSAWMDSYLFKEWFVNEFVPKVKSYLKSNKLPIKAVLILDNAPTHPQELECDINIKLHFLPPNVTSLIQPMDQGVIESLKRRYRRKFLSEILERTEKNKTGLISALKTLNIKDVIYMLAAAFEEIPDKTFVKSWRKIWPDLENILASRGDDNPSVLEKPENHEELNISFLSDLNLLPDCEEIDENDVEEWLKSDDQLENEILTDDEIITAVCQQEGFEEEEEEEEEEGEEKLSHEEGKQALDVATRYIEQQKESTSIDVMFIKKWRDYAFQQSIKTKRQKRITDFFQRN
ncbi:MAG: hypothetical protein ACL7AX_13685 [Candidatus Arsenophonus phytopathogenicus]